MLPHVDDLAALLRVIGAAPAHLVGHSWGALICLLAAIRHPEMVRSLVLQEPPVLSLVVSTPPPLRELLPLFVRRPRTALAILEFGAGTIAPAQRAFRRGDDDRALQAFAHGVLGKETYERLPAERKQQARENLGTLRAQLLGAGFPPLDEEDVRGVGVPTLLMTGQRSPAVLLRLTEHLQRLLPHAERVDGAGASHGMQEENPGAVKEAILGFMPDTHRTETCTRTGAQLSRSGEHGCGHPSMPARRRPPLPSAGEQDSALCSAVDGVREGAVGRRAALRSLLGGSASARIPLVRSRAALAAAAQTVTTPRRRGDDNEMSP